MKKLLWQFGALNVIACLFILTAGCGGSAPTDEPAAVAASQPRTNAASSTKVITTRTPRRVDRELPGIADLVKQYSSARTAQEKIAVVHQLAEHGSRPALETARSWFEKETDADVKEQMLRAIWPIDGLEKEKLAIYRIAVKSDQPKALRESAIDDVSDLEDPAAASLLKELLKDPDPEIQEAAKDALEFLSQA